MMGATLANMGCHPIHGRSAFSIAYVKDLLSIMFTCGMYDYSGQWAYRGGRAGKERGLRAASWRWSTVRLGIGTYSPRLDRFGNSVRGTDVCIDLASRLGLHVFDCV
jgi:glutaminase